MENEDKEILDWMDIDSKNSCFITLKDNKETFRIILQCDWLTQQKMS